METHRENIRERLEKSIREEINMSYDTNTESKLSFNLPTILKQELEEVCVRNERTQSQILREAVSSYVRYIKQQYIKTA